jgi:RES domain-containing protein
MIVYRIADCKYVNDLSGLGAAKYGGRWNSKETYMVYTAQSASLALLETVVHMAALPGRLYCMVTLSVPVDEPQLLTEKDLPPGWQQQPPPDILKVLGDRFISAGRQLVLGVPSVIMPGSLIFC